jgi:hypothetical protein
MLLKPSSISRIGVVQFFLALSFVIWLLFFPNTGGSFAWPVVPRLTAMFLGTSFILRVFMGYLLYRERDWYRLRWIKWGNFAFLGVILLATFWHVDEMNWTANIVVAHIWVVAYVVEPLILVLIEPHGPESTEPVPINLSSGPIQPGLKFTLSVIFVVGITLGALLEINPAFMNTRWPWTLDPFDARVMAAWMAGSGVWAATMYFAKDWVEIKTGVQSLILYAVALFVLWSITFTSYDPARNNRLTMGVAAGAAALALGYSYWKQERSRKKAGEETIQPAMPAPLE